MQVSKLSAVLAATAVSTVARDEPDVLTITATTVDDTQLDAIMTDLMSWEQNNPAAHSDVMEILSTCTAFAPEMEGSSLTSMRALDIQPSVWSSVTSAVNLCITAPNEDFQQVGCQAKDVPILKAACGAIVSIVNEDTAPTAATFATPTTESAMLRAALTSGPMPTPFTPPAANLKRQEPLRTSVTIANVNGAQVSAIWADLMSFHSAIDTDSLSSAIRDACSSDYRPWYDAIPTGPVNVGNWPDLTAYVNSILTAPNINVAPTPITCPAGMSAARALAATVADIIDRDFSSYEGSTLPINPTPTPSPSPAPTTATETTTTTATISTPSSSSSGAANTLSAIGVAGLVAGFLAGPMVWV